MPGFLAVASFKDGVGRLVYVWQGVPGVDWHISHNVIRGLSSYLIAGAAEVGPYSAYRFTLGARGGRIVEIYDNQIPLESSCAIYALGPVSSSLFRTARRPGAFASVT